ncbi:MAG: lysine--tRNA ligase [Candidatus Hodarchaeota archaeon]
MNEESSVHWLENIAEEISERKESLITLATGKTPSGHIHVGILREIIICDALRRIFEKKGENVRFFLFLDSLDAAKRFPEYIDKKFQLKHRGKPFSFIPCPFDECGCKSYAHHFGNELISTFKDFGIKTEVIWSHELYQTKEMIDKIKIALENSDKIKKILRKYILPTLDEGKRANFLKMQEKWMPVMAICEECDKIQSIDKDGSIKPNRVLKYIKREQKVSYICSACGYAGELTIDSGRLKLNWRVDWPAKWSIYRTTCEPAGKDHSVKGGAYDTGLELCQEIYGYEGPVKIPYEWLRLGDRDMKTSKGIVFTPKTYLEIANPEVFRMIVLRTNPMKHISFRIEELPQYYDYYERMEEIYFSKNEGDDMKNLQYIFSLSQIGKIPDKKGIKIPLKLLIFLSQIQNILSLERMYEKAKEAIDIKNFEESITIEEFQKLINQTNNWLNEVKKAIEVEKDAKIKKEILSKINIFSIPQRIDNKILDNLDENQRKGLSKLRTYLVDHEKIEADSIQNKIFSIAKEDLNIPPKKLFEAIYQIILGRKNGPKLGPFLKILDKEWLLNRLNI